MKAIKNSTTVRSPLLPWDKAFVCCPTIIDFKFPLCKSQFPPKHLTDAELSFKMHTTHTNTHTHNQKTGLQEMFVYKHWNICCVQCPNPIFCWQTTGTVEKQVVQGKGVLCVGAIGIQRQAKDCPFPCGTGKEPRALGMPDEHSAAELHPGPVCSWGEHVAGFSVPGHVSADVAAWRDGVPWVPSERPRSLLRCQPECLFVIRGQKWPWHSGLCYFNPPKLRAVGTCDSWEGVAWGFNSPAQDSRSWNMQGRLLPAEPICRWKYIWFLSVGPSSLSNIGFSSPCFSVV